MGLIERDPYKYRISFVKSDRGLRMRALYLVHYGYPPFSAGWFTFSDVPDVAPGRAFGSGEPFARVGQTGEWQWPKADVGTDTLYGAAGGGSVL